MESIIFGTSRHYIKISKESITFERKSWPGNTSEQLCSTKNIKRIYVAFQVSWFVDDYDTRNKVIDYGAWIAQKKGEKIKLFGKDTALRIANQQQAQDIVKKINSFLQTDNKPKSNIIRKRIPNKAKIVKEKLKILRRKILKEKDLTKLKIQDLRK